MHTALVLLVIGSTVTVDSSFTGFEQQLSSAARSDLGKKGWNKCGYAGVTEAPVVEFKLTAAIEGLELEVGVDSVLTAEGTFECVKAGKKTQLSGTGSRALYFIDRPSAGGAKATVRLFSRAQTADLAKKAAESTLRLTLDGKGLNPLYGSIAAGKGIDPAEAGLDCVRDGKVRPVAQLEVTQSSTFEFAVKPTASVYVQTADGKCLSKHFELSAGLATLWVDARDGLSELAVIDTERDTQFEEAPHYKLSALPLLVRSTAREAGGWMPPSLCVKEGYGCKGLPRAPSFYLSVDAPMEELFVDTRLGDQVKLQFIGAGVRPCELGHNVRTCGDGFSRVKDLRAGELAVWVSGEAQDVLVAFKTRAEVSRLTRTGAPTENLRLEDRSVGWHFPFWQLESRLNSDDRHDVISLFAAAPAGLFVFLKKPMEGTPVTEPLLIQRVLQGHAEVVSLTGKEQRVRLDVLTAERPAELTFPALPAFKAGITVDDAMGLAGPDEQKLVDAYLAKESEHNGCVGGWMEKNDPTWGKSYELVNVRTGQTLSSMKFKQAHAVCGWTKLEKASKAFITAINSSQKKLRSSVTKEVKQRLSAP